MLSIGKLAPGHAGAQYYLERVGCPLEYYTGRGEAAGAWIGRGADALGLTGRLRTPEQEQVLRNLLAGVAPDGTQLVAPVLRGDPRSRVPTAPVVRALQELADERGVDVEDLLRPAPAARTGRRPAADAGDHGPPPNAQAEDLLKAWNRGVADLERARRRPRWPAPTLAVDVAERLLTAVGLDAQQVLAETTPTGRLRDRLALALRHREDRVDVRMPGLDLTLSAPKSVSVLFALSPHPEGHDHGGAGAAGERERVGRLAQDAHRLAVAEALAYLELTCTSALRGHHRGDGTDTRVQTDGLIGAAFEHRSSRCGDPQLHTHVVVANLLHGQDGKWSALDTREIYAQARTAGFVYQAVLRGELTRTLGVQWGPVRNGQAEISGLPVGLLRLFSKRRAQIEAQLELVGLDSPAAAQAATLSTRPGKPDLHGDGDGAGHDESGVGLQERWRAEAAAAGFTSDVVDQTLGRVSVGQSSTAARQAAAAVGALADDLAEALLTPTGLTDKRASFDRRDLLRGVCEQLEPGTPVRLTGLRTLATRVLRDPRVVPLLGEAPVRSRRYSTRELLALEQDALRLARSLNGLPNTGPDEQAIIAEPPQVGVVPDKGLRSARAHATRLGLSAEQQRMLDRLLTSGAGVEVIVGAAGSGKTAALAVAAQAWADSGVPVQGTALAAIAARVLQDSAGIPSQSLQRLLNQTSPHQDRQDQDGPQLGGPKVGSVLPPGGVLVVDEAGMVGTRTLHRLLVLAETTRTKLVLVGDPKQLPEIDAGGLFATLTRQDAVTTLVGNQRQQQRWEQRALRELRDGDVVRALTAYRRHQRLRITDTIGDLTARLLEDYEQHLTRHDPGQVLVVASSRGDARRLNAQLRQRLLTDGRLGPDELRIDLGNGGHRGYRRGEQVLVSSNDYPLGLLNGTRGTVTDLDLDRLAVTVRLDDGRTVHLDADYLSRGHLTHGYALTAHKAQGVTVDVALLWGTHALTRETGYVALSRGRRGNYLYSTWDLLRRDTGLVDSDLHPPRVRPQPDETARRGLTRAGLAERLTTSGAQRTARSWWRRRSPSPAEAPRPAARALGHGR
jgi:conjugative relaxase-like TrwC/TraI family protein